MIGLVLKNSQEAVSMVKPIPEPEEAAKRLMQEAYQRGSSDNITIIIVRFLANEGDASHSGSGWEAALCFSKEGLIGSNMNRIVSKYRKKTDLWVLFKRDNLRQEYAWLAAASQPAYEQLKQVSEPIYMSSVRDLLLFVLNLTVISFEYE